MALVYRLIDAGKIEEANYLLRGLTLAESADAEQLSLLARLADDPDSCFARYFRSLDLKGDPDVLVQTLVGLTDYALATGQTQWGLEFIKRHQKRARGSHLYSRLLLNKAYLLLSRGNFSGVKGELEQALRWESNSQLVAKLLLTLGDIELAQGDFDAAQSYYRDLAHRSSQRYAGLALLRLADSYLRQGDIDNAHFTYNVLVSRYPRTVGLDQLRERFLEPGESGYLDDTVPGTFRRLDISRARDVLCVTSF